MARKTKVVEATEPQTETPIETTPAPAEKPAKKKRSKADASLEVVFAGYLDGLEQEGKAGGTIDSYRMELQLAATELGLDTRVADLTPDRVLLFFSSDRVMKKRNGKAKSQLSIDKTRRVLRQALMWAEAAKMVAQAPLPDLAASH